MTAPQSVGNGVTAVGAPLRAGVYIIMSYLSLPKKLFIVTENPFESLQPRGR